MPSSTYVATQPGPFAALLQASDLGGLHLDPLPPVRVRDVYLDTETGALLGNGYAFRARTFDGVTTLTLRPLSGEGPAFEAAAAGDPSDLPAGPLSDAIAHLSGGEPLAPILRLRQYRTPRIAYDAERLVGLVSFDVVVYELDDGHVVANEVEVELNAPAHERDADRLDRVLQNNGLAPAGRSKMERGLTRARRSLDQPVLLLPHERDELQRLRASGTTEERRRAHIVLLDARGYHADTIATQTQTAPTRVESVRRQFRVARMDAMHTGDEIGPAPADATQALGPARDAVAEFEDLDALLEAFHAPADDTPVFGGNPVATLEPVPVFVPDVGWERSASLNEPPPPAFDDADAEWVGSEPRFEPIGDALTTSPSSPADELRQVDAGRAEAAAVAPDAATEAPHGQADREAPSGAAAPGAAAPGAEVGRESWVRAAVAPTETASSPPTVSDAAPRSWIDAAIAPAAPRATPQPAPPPTMWSHAGSLEGALAGAPAPDTDDPFASVRIGDLRRRVRVNGDTPILEAAWLTIGHQVSAFEAAADALFQSTTPRPARRLFLSAHRVRLALESFAPYLPERAVERMTGSLRRLVLTLDTALDYDRATGRAPRLAGARDAHLAAARDILEGGRQRAWGHRSRRLLGRLQAQGQEGLLIGDDFPAPPDDFIGEVGDRPVPSRLKHVLGSLVWRRYEDILAFEDEIDGEVPHELAYHLATAVSGLHFVLGLAESQTPEAARELARVLDQAEALAAAYRYERRTAELSGSQGPFEHSAQDVRDVWRLLASAEFRRRLATVAIGA